MNTDQTIQGLRSLRLTAMADRYEEYIKLSNKTKIDTHTLVAMLVEAQIDFKDNRRFYGLLKQSNLRFMVFPEDITPSIDRGLSPEQWLLMCEGKYLEQSSNLFFTGPTGSGKTYCSCALGYKACQMGHKVKFIKFSKFADNIKIAKVEGNIQKLLDQYTQVKVLILDDWGLDLLDREASLYLHDILDERYNRVPTIITSQFPVSEWYNFIKEPSLSESVLDRIMNNAININLKGKSRRVK